jgi:hypothetical protein
MIGTFRFRTHTHTPQEVRNPRWTGRRSPAYHELSWVDLVRAGVLSSLTARPDVSALRLEGEFRAAHAATAFRIDSNGAPFLRSAFAASLRDSTRTGRAGDFGQALGWLITQQILGLPFVVDYEQFCKAVNHQHHGANRRPDYVAFASLDATTFTLVECKGRWYTDAARSTRADWRTALNDAHAQCQSGCKHFTGRRVLGAKGIGELVSICSLGNL